MEVSALHPPNSQQLSDNVISDVLQQRSKISRGVYVGINGIMTMDTVPPPLQRPRLEQRHTQTHECEETGIPSRNIAAGRWGKHQDINDMLSALKEKLQRPDTSALAESMAHDGQLKVMVDLIIADKLRLRELRRVRQIRYRKKKDDYANSLDERNKKLRVEIEELTERRRAVLTAASAKESGWSVAVEYFRLFQFGVRDTRISSSSVQVAFLQATMASDILFNMECGIKSIIGCWYYICQWFDKFDMELDALSTAASGTLVATTITSITISEHTIRKVFPHLLSSEDPSGMSPLAQELIGKTIVMNGTARFEWDRERCRVGAIRSQSDLVTPVLGLLVSLDKVARVFSNALITPEFHCKLPGSRRGHS
ncbi:hypothetical protein F441_14945 [Phytophthora nicotianae CJ01A1]|uniref:BZIP domain-containing protein n=2 Tax=Phytophthora nicotianae TaxID=4792 RepID=W2WFP3_PHYNI|nr:hypothetical protein F441_14945 [Phytophthora nicotianae CJ01A1]